jgi:hypothetical protein
MNTTALFLRFSPIVCGLTPHPEFTDATNQAIELLRSPDHFQWYLIPVFVIILNIYFIEISKKNWNLVFAGLALYSLQWFFEILNALFFHFHGTSALWTVPGVNAATGTVNTSYLLTVGLNIEISVMFLFLGLSCARFLPEDKKKKILGMPNRLVLASFFAALCVIIEIVLNFWDVLIWEYPRWSTRNPILIFLLAYFPLMFFAFRVHDMEPVRKKIIVVSSMFALDAVLLIVFMGVLQWI